MRTTRRLVFVVLVILAVNILGAIVSIAARWPYQFGGQGSRDNMLGDFLSSGTALAAPPIILVVLVLATVLARRKGAWGAVGCIVLILLAAAMIVGALGEAFAAPTPDVPRPVQLIDGAIGLILGVTLGITVIASLRERNHPRAVTGGVSS